ncbi:SDR family oxidoreductase [Bacillus songklensis]|uniref:SDR family oxidoreductase n=1 Tax=Bacillus songklensis TaxID=1069116 RepID=A0ABV8B468_9BACI
MDLQLKGKTAIVLASSQGLGKAIAVQLIKEGVNVMLASRSEEKLRATAEELSSLADGKAVYTIADVTQKESIQMVVKRTIEYFGTVDILVNNAGGPKAGNIESLTDDDWQDAFELNLLSYIRTIREVLPYMKKRGGHIINIASSSIKEPIPGLVLSNTFRTGIVGLTKTLSQELGEYNILVNTVAPGRIATERVEQLDQISAKNEGISKEEVKEKVKSTISLGRYGEPEEFAKVVAFLVSGANTYMTGNSFLVDGGMVKSI